jgi:hypothetical protein
MRKLGSHALEPKVAVFKLQDYGRRNRTKSYSEEDNLEYEVVEPNEPEPMDAPEYATPSPLPRKVRQRTSRQY